MSTDNRDIQIFINGDPIGVTTSAIFESPKDPPYPVEVTKRLSGECVFEFEGLFELAPPTIEYKVFIKHIDKLPKRSFRFRTFGAWAYLLTRYTKVTHIEDIAYLSTKDGVYILPKDGSYVRFISNKWYS